MNTLPPPPRYSVLHQIRSLVLNFYDYKEVIIALKTSKTTKGLMSLLETKSYRYGPVLQCQNVIRVTLFWNTDQETNQFRVKLN